MAQKQRPRGHRLSSEVSDAIRYRSSSVAVERVRIRISHGRCGPNRWKPRSIFMLRLAAMARRVSMVWRLGRSRRARPRVPSQRLVTSLFTPKKLSASTSFSGTWILVFSQGNNMRSVHFRPQMRWIPSLDRVREVHHFFLVRRTRMPSTVSAFTPVPTYSARRRRDGPAACTVCAGACASASA